VREVLIVGGGLFPRSALVLAELLPRARLTIIEAVPAHAARAAGFLAGVMPGRVRFVTAPFAAVEARADLVAVPLAFRGDRAALYRRPPARLLAVHDWIWRVRGYRGVVVSWWLLKRLNLVEKREWQPSALLLSNQRDAQGGPSQTGGEITDAGRAVPLSSITPVSSPK
jgi:hypothetical protein